MNRNSVLLFFFLVGITSYANIFADSDSIFQLGVDYFNGVNGKYMDRDRGFQLQYRAAEMGQSDAMFELGCMYHNGVYVERNDSTALDWFKKAATKRHAKALDNCGLCYINGVGVEKNPTIAFDYFHQGAELGYSECLFNLGVCYENGDGTETNYSEAAKCFRQAAELNHPEAQYALAKCYYFGDGLKKDWDQTFYWAKLSFENGILDGANLAGVICQKSNPIEAFELFKKAYEGGDYYGRRNYADALRQGIGCEKNLLMAAEVYMNALEEEDPHCLFYLGTLILEHDMIINFPDAQLRGKKVKQFAKKLISFAAEHDFEEAIQYCDNHKIKYNKK